jgi:hypothetical protein
VHEFESVVAKQKVDKLRDLPVIFTVQTDIPPKAAHIRFVVRDAQNEHHGNR